MNLGARRYTYDELKSVGFKALGENVQISNRASLYGVQNISIGDNVRIDDFATIIATNELIIGNYVTIHNYCFLGCRSGIYLDDFVTLAPGVKLFSASDDYSGKYLTGAVVPFECTRGECGPIHIKKHAILGANSIAMPKITIDEGTSVGANSFLKKDTQAWSIYYGTPAKRIKNRNKKMLKYSCKIEVNK